jgi:hypothetical protein
MEFLSRNVNLMILPCVCGLFRLSCRWYRRNNSVCCSVHAPASSNLSEQKTAKVEQIHTPWGFKSPQDNHSQIAYAVSWATLRPLLWWERWMLIRTQCVTIVKHISFDAQEGISNANGFTNSLDDTDTNDTGRDTNQLIPEELAFHQRPLPSDWDIWLTIPHARYPLVYPITSIIVIVTDIEW